MWACSKGNRGGGKGGGAALLILSEPGMETATEEEYMLKGSVRSEDLGFEESIRMLGRPAGSRYLEVASMLAESICAELADNRNNCS